MTAMPGPSHVWVDGGSAGRRARTSRRSIAASSSATASSRRSAPEADTRPSWPSTWPACAGPPHGLAIALPAGLGCADRDRHRRPARGGGPRRARRRRLGPDHRLARAVPRSRPPAAGRGRRRDDRRSRPGRSSPAPGGAPGAGPPPRRVGVRRDPANPLAALKTTSRADYVYARLEARRAGADDALFLTIDGLLSEGTTANIFLVRLAADGTSELATPSLDCAILPGTTRSWLLAWAAAVGLRPVKARLTTARPRRGRRGVPVLERGRRAAGHPVRRARRSATGSLGRGPGRPGPTARRCSAATRTVGPMTRDELIAADPPAHRGGRAPRGRPVDGLARGSGSSDPTTCSRRRGGRWIATTSRG